MHCNFLNCNVLFCSALRKVPMHRSKPLNERELRAMHFCTVIYRPEVSCYVLKFSAFTAQMHRSESTFRSFFLASSQDCNVM